MQNNFKKILITGGAGYIGSILVNYLLDDNYQVRVLDRLDFGVNPIIQYFANENFEFIKGDIRDKDVLQAALENVDVVIHLAGIVGYPACRKFSKESREINVDATKLLVDLMAGKKPILFASSGSTYGKMIEKLCTETSPINPLTNYGEHKAEGEKIIQGNKEYIIYRFATAFGASPRMRLDLMPNDFTYRAVHDKTLIVYEKNFMRTFIHVRDMAQSFVFALKNYEKMKNQIYNIGDNQMNYSKEDICLMIKKHFDYYLHFADIGHDLDQRNYVVSYEKINNQGFKCKTTMEEGIQELIKICSLIDNKNIYYNT